MIDPRELSLYQKLVVEANAQLQLFKLPKEIFGHHENLIKSTHYDMFRKQLGEDPMLHHKKKLISHDNQMKRGIMLQN
jgi:hypothetical protein